MSDVEKITRQTYIERSKDRWRMTCPNGHFNIKLKKSKPILRSSGHEGMSEMKYYHSKQQGKEWTGSFYCKTCGEAYSRVRDRKTGTIVQLFQEPDERKG